MNLKKFVIYLVSVLGVTIISIFAFIGVSVLQRNLNIPKVHASPSTCTVNDDLDVSGDLTVHGSSSIGWEMVSANYTVSPGHRGGGTVDCPSGKRLLGGGCYSGIVSTVLEVNVPLDQDTWWCQIGNDDPTNSAHVTVYAICARVVP